MDIEAQGGYKDDPEFDELTERLADEIFDISATNGRLWAHLRASNPDKAADLAAKNRAQFRSLKADVERIQQWPNNLPAQKYTQTKLVREFAEAFSEFQRIQKQIARGERQLVQEARKINPPPETPAYKDIDGAPGIELQQQQSFEEQLRQDEVAYQQGLIEERQEEIRGIEQGIVELNEIFTNLSNVIAEQGSVIDNIEANIYSVAQNTRDGAGELVKAARWQRRTGGRMLCFLIILLIFALVIILSVLA
ncbi:Syntaxin PEP12 [Wickerhamiella sorbophila]|uniref:Syntaxin PEP12 n=1 Tax=Wickerhamiella sorbophila TaxID=45607 RepID=A0A2T0FC24_9ASCO|nr:Syntaxin PEP12 [Wickerhamiella sorbophila]PRT52563.1 Syntaxin PEP12 [Wickerhamiella sorbophila]